jgi:hypothetical protein
MKASLAVPPKKLRHTGVVTVGSPFGKLKALDAGLIIFRRLLQFTHPARPNDAPGGSRG